MRIAILTSGGDGPGMNAAIRAIVRSAEARGLSTVGIRGGYDGIFAEAIVPLSGRAVANILQRGGTVLGTGRSAKFLEPDAWPEAAGVLRRKGVDALAVIGGNGSYRGLAALQQATGFRVVGLPGSIDNDVGGTDVSIGFSTAVATAVQAIDRIRDTAFSQPRTFYVEVMGRDSGHIAAAVALASGAEAVLVPEIKTDVAALAARIDQSFRLGKRASIIVVSEGDDEGDAAEIARKVAAASPTPHEYRVIVLGHIQRGGDATADDRILASRLGARAVDALIAGEDPCVVGLRNGRAVATPLAQAVAEKPALDLAEVRLCELLAGFPRTNTP